VPPGALVLSESAKVFEMVVLPEKTGGSYMVVHGNGQQVQWHANPSMAAAAYREDSREQQPVVLHIPLVTSPSLSCPCHSPPALVNSTHTPHFIHVSSAPQGAQ
jgi:hypothetical protein